MSIAWHFDVLRVRACAVLPVLMVAACSSRLPHEGPPWDPPRDARKAMARYDTNGDGFIGPGEIEISPGLSAALPRADQDGDGRLDEWEITARISLYRDCRTMRLPCTCHVTIGDEPLVGAEVRLAPDEFLGTTITAAAGLTDENGAAELKIEGAAELGVHPGMYRVEISKKDATGQETIGAWYNRETTFGHEAAPDAGPVGAEPKFALTAEGVSR